MAGKFLVLQKGVPLGELAANAVSRLRGSSSMNPPVKMECRSVCRRSGIPNHFICAPCRTNSMNTFIWGVTHLSRW